MYRTRKERFKSYILAILIAASIIQVGILWNHQNHGLPINILAAFFTNFTNSGLSAGASDESARNDFFNPYRIVISNGDWSYWKTNKGEESYEELWRDARLYLGQALSSKSPQAVLPLGQWGELIQKRTLIFDFKTNVKTDLMKWFLKLSDTPAEGPAGVYKVLLLPDINENNNTLSLYILDESKIYQYDLAVRPEGYIAKKFGPMVEKLEQDKEREQKEFSVIKEMDRSGKSKKFSSFSPDILCITRVPKDRQYHNLTYTAPERISNIEEVANILLGNERDSFVHSEDKYGTLIYNNLDGIYRVYVDGLLEYKYTGGSEGQEKGDLAQVFMNAYRFVNRGNMLLNSKAVLYLTGIKENQNSYEFTFDYKIGGYPIYMDLGAKGKEGKPVQNAVVIRANGKRILEGRWILKNFEFGSGEKSFNVDFTNLMESSGLNPNDMLVKDMGVSYVIKSDTNKKADLLWPVWAVEETNGKMHGVMLPEMPESKGD